MICGGAILKKKKDFLEHFQGPLFNFKIDLFGNFSKQVTSVKHTQAHSQSFPIFVSPWGFLQMHHSVPPASIFISITSRTVPYIRELGS